MIVVLYHIFFFNDTATTEIYTLSLHDALPICRDDRRRAEDQRGARPRTGRPGRGHGHRRGQEAGRHRRVRREVRRRSEEHTSELQSRQYLVCRLLLEKKKKKHKYNHSKYYICE